MKPKLLVMEDKKVTARAVAREFGDIFECHQAHTIRQAEAIIAEQPDLFIILVDALMPLDIGDEPTLEDTMILLMQLKSRGNKAIRVAFSAEHNADLMDEELCHFCCLFKSEGNIGDLKILIGHILISRSSRRYQKPLPA